MRTILLFIFTLCSTILLAQVNPNSANIWFFGDHAGVNFNSGNPIGSNDGQMFTPEGVASICDKNGSLLFYTNGVSVWDKNHETMPNGDASLNGHISSNQSSIILPNPADSMLYYIFTIDELGGNNGLSYSLVDLSLPGNGSPLNPTGDIDNNTFNIPLISPVGEKVTAVVNANKMDYWVITHGWNNNYFFAFEVTSNGVNHTPVFTSIGNIHSGGIDNINAVGYLKSSPQWNKLAVVNRTTAGVDIYDFNPETGSISNEISVPLENPLTHGYGLEFSKDGYFLFIGYPTYVLRYEMETGLSDIIEIDDSSPFSGPYISIRGLQLGPDGKIYLSIRDHDHLSVISNPESDTPVITADGVFLDIDNSDRKCKDGLPNVFYYEGFLNPTNVTTPAPAQTTNIYPNPFDKRLIIESNNKSIIALINVEGKVMQVQIIGDNKSSITTEKIPAGEYFLVIYDYYTKELLSSRKLIKSQ